MLQRNKNGLGKGLLPVNESDEGTVNIQLSVAPFPIGVVLAVIPNGSADQYIFDICGGKEESRVLRKTPLNDQRGAAGCDGGCSAGSGKGGKIICSAKAAYLDAGGAQIRFYHSQTIVTAS